MRWVYHYMVFVSNRDDFVVKSCDTLVCKFDRLFEIRDFDETMIHVSSTDIC